MGLRRPHAEVIANDTAVIASFRRHCKSGWRGGRWNQCKVDEVYMPTLLAVLGRDAETDCKGYLVRRPAPPTGADDPCVALRPDRSLNQPCGGFSDASSRGWL